MIPAIITHQLQENNITNVTSQIQPTNEIRIMQSTSTIKTTFLSIVLGFGTIIGLLVFTYILAKVMDYYCSHSGVVSPDTSNVNVIGGRIARDTGLLGLTKQERESILTRILHSKRYDIETNEEKECPICINEYKQDDELIQSSSCHHIFHQSCLLEWLVNQRKDECPCCRVEMFSCEEYRDNAKFALGEERVMRAIMDYDPRNTY